MLARALDSALAQTYRSLEIIVVNDGSPDPITRLTAEQYAGRITYIERENGGVAAARNSGIAPSKGELIALLDQDDVWLPNKLATQVRAWQAHRHVGLVHSGYYLIDKDGKRTGVNRLNEREWKPLPGLLMDVPIASCTVLFPRRVLEEAGPFDPALAGSDDWDLWLRMAALGYSFYCTGEPLAEYRVHEANTSRDIDLMVRAGVGVLDKFYALPNLPAEASRWRERAYFRRHAWAASLYYGARRHDNAREHLRHAANVYPQGIATGRFLQSMVYAGTDNPSPETAIEAVTFARQALSGADLPPGIMGKLEAYAKVVVALHASKGKRVPLAALAQALVAAPLIATDHSMWTAALRAGLRAGKRVANRIPSIFLSRAPQVRGAPWYAQQEFKYGGTLTLASLVPNGSHGRMLAMIPSGSRVLETGCANGRFSSVLVEHGCRVMGVELDPDAAAKAAEFCERVIIGDLEDAKIQAQIPEGFDVMLFGDVLEHLARPWEVLRALRPRLNPGGCVVISIPNIAHWDARMGLLLGRFEYQYEGVLDGTHLRFFTQRTLGEMLEQSGYSIVDTSRVTTLPAWIYSIRLVRRYAPKVLLPLLERVAPNLFTLQFVVKAAPRAGDEP
jgi:glycosyltransferase involved in cell wall biosynthesis/2-polyprenyl-3-methyl-5-hydroxy-6-metoxy-1,4-benzoquinol methylase